MSEVITIQHHQLKCLPPQYVIINVSSRADTQLERALAMDTELAIRLRDSKSNKDDVVDEYLLGLDELPDIHKHALMTHLRLNDKVAITSYCHPSELSPRHLLIYFLQSRGFITEGSYTGEIVTGYTRLKRYHKISGICRADGFHPANPEEKPYLANRKERYRLGLV